MFFPISTSRRSGIRIRPICGGRDAQVGIGYFVTGLAHLLAYRVIKYYHRYRPRISWATCHTLALFLAANYAPLLHVSGYFHIITGIFHLFGFGLPRTHHNYFLASSFTDVWRRINIPWKEFMAKLFFFPAFFAARRLGTRYRNRGRRPVGVVMTWFLHCYQVFWITGNFSLSFYDAGLWIVVGILVAWNL